MKILIHGINYAPELTGIGKYTGEMAEWLASRGHEVRVVTAPPYYPEWKIGAGYSGWWYRRETLNGVRLWRCPIYVPRRASGLKRILHLASFALSSLPVMLRHVFWPPDLVWVVEPAFFCAPTAWLTARLSGARCWLHIQDFEIDAAFELGLLKGERIRRWVSRFESGLMRRFDRVSTISKAMLRRLQGKGVTPENALPFPNWVDTDAIFPQERPSPFRKELGISEEQVVALYAGNLGEKQGLEWVIEAAKALAQDRQLRFVICGNGAARDRLRQAAAGLSNILWLPLQPVERLNDLLNLADIHLLPQRADAADLVMPSKLTGMLASGRPVIAMAHEGTEIAEAMKGAGVLVPPGELTALISALEALANDPSYRKKLGAVGRQYSIRYLSKEAVLEAFEESALRGSSALGCDGYS